MGFAEVAKNVFLVSRFQGVPHDVCTVAFERTFPHKLGRKDPSRLRYKGTAARSREIAIYGSFE
jgi:hypothetical protein